MFLSYKGVFKDVLRLLLGWFKDVFFLSVSGVLKGVSQLLYVCFTGVYDVEDP